MTTLPTGNEGEEAQGRWVLCFLLFFFLGFVLWWVFFFMFLSSPESFLSPII
jgi:hypothetical protein